MIRAVHEAPHPPPPAVQQSKTEDAPQEEVKIIENGMRCPYQTMSFEVYFRMGMKILAQSKKGQYVQC